MKKYIKSSPYFFRLIKRAFLSGVFILLGLATVIPAPLELPADPGEVPNPAKSAWFLIWLQELVSYSQYLIYLAVLAALGFATLPWWSGKVRAQGASWLPRDQRLVNGLTLITFSVILILTIIATVFRGENWSFALPL